MIVALFAAALAVAHGVSHWYPITFGQLGTRDGVQYWAALKVALAGGNPYNPLEMLALEETIGYRHSQPVMMWNPPWTAILTAPWMWGGFSEAMWAWRFAQILCVVLFWRLLTPLTASIEQKITSAACLALFYPVLDSFHSGQFGIVMMVGVALLLHPRAAESPKMLVPALILFLCKPHLFLPIFTFLALTKRLHLLLLALGLCVSATLVLLGADVMHQWLTSLYAPLHPDMITHLVDYRGDTLSASIRSLAFTAGLGKTPWIIALFACLSVGSGIVVKQTNKSFEVAAPILILLGLLLAPYGWMSDYAIIAPLLISSPARLAIREYRIKVAIFLLALAVTAILCTDFLHETAWILTVLVYIVVRQTRDPLTYSRNLDPEQTSVS